MPPVFSLHHYKIAEGVQPGQLAQAFNRAKEAGLFELPGLEVSYLLYGIKGQREGQVISLWQYNSRQAWQKLWGNPDQPTPAIEYPPSWIRWEREFLAPLIKGDPDKISFTSYEVTASFLADVFEGGNESEADRPNAA